MRTSESKTTSKLYDSSAVLNLKFLNELAATMIGTVPQRVWRHPLLDLGHLGGGVNDAVELARRQRQQPIAAREQPHRRPRNAIPIAEEIEQHWREHRIAIPSAPCLVRSAAAFAWNRCRTP